MAAFTNCTNGIRTPWLMLILSAAVRLASSAVVDGANGQANNHSCFNEDRVNLSATPPQDGRFVCPEGLSAGASDLTECCGPDRREFCCSPWDTIGMKWAIGIGVTVAVVIFMALGYTIQLFRACDKCYHEFPVLCEPEDYQFSMDTRWYTVSHEGNRYGVTFHSKRFANHFMQLLELAYGPWNAANILRIRKDDQDFVVLHIFFNDFFTPWFYTQGPIKNDEEWIRTEFKELCHRTQDDLVVRLPTCCTCCGQRRQRRFSSRQQSENIELIIVPPIEDTAQFESELLPSPPPHPDSGDEQGIKTQEAAASMFLSPNWTSSGSPTRVKQQGRNGSVSSTKQLQLQLLQHQQNAGGLDPIIADPCVRKKDHRPWTKHTFKIRPPPRSSQPPPSSASGGRVTTVIREDIIECYGNDKAVQTRCEIVI